MRRVLAAAALLAEKGEWMAMVDGFIGVFFCVRLRFRVSVYLLRYQYFHPMESVPIYPRAHLNLAKAFESFPSYEQWSPPSRTLPDGS